jgi:hypothetical protein
MALKWLSGGLRVALDGTVALDHAGERWLRNWLRGYATLASRQWEDFALVPGSALPPWTGSKWTSHARHSLLDTRPSSHYSLL